MLVLFVDAGQATKLGLWGTVTEGAVQPAMAIFLSTASDSLRGQIGALQVFVRHRDLIYFRIGKSPVAS